MVSYVRESCILSRVLDSIGYNRRMVKFRQNIYRNIEFSQNNLLNEFQFNVVFAGSKAEGLTAPLENDYDKMFITMHVFCSQHPASVRNRDDITVFYMDMRHAAPGYTFLQPVNICGNFDDRINECLVPVPQGQMYLSSDIWRHTIKRLFRDKLLPGDQGLVSMQEEDHGPSLTESYVGNAVDNVQALVCDCPGYLNAWSTRDRAYQWPSDNVIRDVFNLEPHVVPVGFAGSSTYFLEWRICFTKGEIRLVHSLNDCLIKVLILLKLIAKTELKPISKDITTYIMKNIIFWIAELQNYDIFTEANLFFVLHLSLRLLKASVLANNLPSYMIPERNLLANRLTNEQRLRVCVRIDSLVNEGPRVVQNCQKLRNAFTMLYRRPEEFSQFSRKRQRVELFELALSCYFNRNLWMPNMTSEQIIHALFSDDVCMYFMFRKLSEVVDLTEEDLEYSPDEVRECINILREGNYTLEMAPGSQYLC